LTLFIGLGGLWVSLIVFALANVSLSIGTIFYDALLPHISRAENRGRISGQGVAAGFAGALLGVAIGAAILAGDDTNKPAVFRVTAIVFFLTALPCLLWVKDPPAARISFSTAFQQARANLRGIVARTREVRHLPRFLIGRIFFTDAANTMFAFMGIYATKEVGFSDAQAQGVLAAGILTGPIGAIVAGRSTDRIGPKRTMDRLLLLWFAVLGCCALIPVLDLPRELFWAVTPFGGIAFGGTTTVDRALLLRIAPHDRQGESFGLFAMIGRFSAILGPLLWAAEVDALHLGRPAAVATLAAFMLVSLLLFRPIRERPL
jgi:UMF1 family MFS transporter